MASGLWDSVGLRRAALGKPLRRSEKCLRGALVRRRRERWKQQKAPQASEWWREGSGGVSVRVSVCVGGQHI
ncbi:MAG: hypothetical protein OCU24_02730 [Candidatus Methanospirare jalkutatii]|nr:hypothetical protein [Candidatus Methanospirare jalkutatii]